jgi:hypothetical protein
VPSLHACRSTLEDPLEGLAGAEVGQEAEVGVAELPRGDRLDAHGDLAGDVDASGQLELGAAAGGVPSSNS